MSLPSTQPKIDDNPKDELEPISETELKIDEVEQGREMNKLIEVYNKLDGYKTYIVAAVLAVLNLVAVTGVIPVDVLNTINSILVALGLGTLRSGVAKK